MTLTASPSVSVPAATVHDRGPPVFEQAVEHGVETLLGRVPRLHQVVVEADLIDRAHRRLGVRVRGKEHALRIGREGLGLRQQLDSRHPGHALVGDDQRHRIAPRGELSQDLQRVLARARGDDREVACVAIAEIALDSSDDLLVVVDREQHGFALGHGWTILVCVLC